MKLVMRTRRHGTAITAADVQHYELAGTASAAKCLSRTPAAEQHHAAGEGTRGRTQSQVLLDQDQEAEPADTSSSAGKSVTISLMRSAPRSMW